MVTELTLASDPEAAALNLPSPVTAVIFADKAVNALIVPPALGFVIDVIDVPWCDAIDVIGLSKLAHCVAVIVDPALTAATVDCPYPWVVLPVPRVPFTVSLKPL